MGKKQKQLNTPVLFLIFNRPDTTRRVFDEIKKAKPKQLFVVADGPRNEEEREKCDAARAVIEQVDWDCEVKKNYSDKNLGCKVRVSSGIDWFFENVEQGIILEDDCLPSQSFFRFCEELLEKYKNDERIMHITGDNFQFGKKRGKAHYFFSIYNHCWGWATWKRAWQHFDVKMRGFSEFKQKNKLKNVFAKKNEQEHWVDIFQRVYDGKINSWAYIWTYICWSQDGLTCTPNINLVSNIGFDERATHTTNKNNKVSHLIAQEIQFPLAHPKIIKANKKADEYTSKNIFGSSQRHIAVIVFLKTILKKIRLFDFTKDVYLKLKNMHFKKKRKGL